MAGLDTRGAWDGFREGFQLMDNYNARQAAQEDRDRQIDLQDRGLEMRDREMVAHRELAERRFGLDEQQMGLQEKRFDRQTQMDERRLQQQDRQFERQMRSDDRRFGLQERELGMRVQERNKDQDMQILRAGYAKIAEGMELGEEEIAAFKRNPWLAPNHIADPRMDAAVAQAAKVFDPNDPADANDPASLEAMNFMFDPYLQRGEGGKKRIVGVYPGQQEGTVAFELEVTREDGQSYRAPMTKNRSTAEDDEVLQVPIEDLVNRVAANKTLSGVLRSSGTKEKALAFGRHMGLIDQFNEKGAPAMVQTAKYLLESGAAGSPQEAWNMASGAKSKSRQDFALDYAKMISSSQDPMAENPVSADAAFQAGLDMYDRLNGGQQQAPSNATAPAKGGEQGSDADSEIREMGLW
ncbi:hypothetical protein IB234_15355 [Pseudomonas sp. PDM16]|uniref:hypothetical protein n=1 Tax=Pseudomonas sp. PDM16 TaxID=2769292 RepID=UPI0017803507|nr:hypothetical protein [Pseudomonas sp. PDM16]MBD9415939.1 hypothetical protein [Pseudomonas sp. PDM16]